ncbi:MAG TPA: hypothetical protein VEB42_12040 [Chitinophagaceae bacterium]|nr:hypothetical protein [Chitinophagaceae bacterium]
MLQDLRAWLNGSREWNAGVSLYNQVGDNDALKSLFSKGKTDYCYQRLQEELLKICKQLKTQKYVHITGTVRSDKPDASVKPIDKVEVERHQPVNDHPAANAELYVVCKAEADKTYKEVMNLRAELFALARPDNFSDVNTPDRIEQRSKIALKVAEGFKHVSQLYDRADYVKIHGRLPDQDAPDGEELDPDGLPDHLVKQTLDNLRKNYNKMKKRQQTPERVALLQTHESNIKKLEARWLLLKPAK